MPNKFKKHFEEKYGKPTKEDMAKVKMDKPKKMSK